MEEMEKRSTRDETLPTKDREKESTEESVERADLPESGEEEAEASEERATAAVEREDEEIHLPSHPADLQSKEKKHHIAKRMVAEAKEIVSASEAEVEECRLLLESDLEAYNEAKAALRTYALEQSETYLKDLGYELAEEEESVIFEPAEEIPPVALEDISSGTFTALMMAIAVGAGVLVGMLYLAAQRLQIPFDLSMITDQATVEKLFVWFTQAVGYTGGSKAYTGAAMVALVVLAVMFLTYWIRVTLKAGKNLHFAQKQLADAQAYVSRKANCKEEMERVDGHIKDAIATLKDYEILLAEQNSKLHRILHFEGLHDDHTRYAARSRETMDTTQTLVETIRRFMATPMSEEGRLSEKSTLMLQHTKEELKKVLERLV